MRRRLLSMQLLALCLLLTACAVRNNPNNPPLTPGTATDLNIAFQLSQANKDYTTFFTDVGEAQRQHILAPGKVAILNKTGAIVKTLLENANATFKTYQATKDAPTRIKVLEYLKQATEKLAALLVERNDLLTTGGVQ